MAHRFEITKELEVGATPEQVWEADRKSVV